MISIKRKGDPDLFVGDKIWIWEVEVDTESEKSQMEVLLKAMEVYAERNIKYKDNWRRMGARGALIRIRERAERLWDSMWERPGPDMDDAIDLINFAAFLVRSDTETTHGGEWWPDGNV